jgi:hypothetical protein
MWNVVSSDSSASTWAVPSYSCDLPGLVTSAEGGAGTDDVGLMKAVGWTDRWTATARIACRAGPVSSGSVVKVAPVSADVMRWKYGKLLANLGNAIEAVCPARSR